MAKNSIYDYSTSPGSNTDIGGIGIQGSNAVNNFDDAFRTGMAQIATDVSPRRMSIWGSIYGLTLSNNTGDATNDIDIAVGMATTDSTTDPRTMVLASALTKRTDAAWAVGSGNGGWLDGASMPNGTGHAFLIQRSDTGVVDVGLSASATAPPMPANYDRKRRIGSIIRTGGTILAFTQVGDVFTLTTPVLNFSSTTAQVNILQAFTLPNGISVQPILTGTVGVNNGSITIQLGSYFQAAAGTTIIGLSMGATGGMSGSLTGGIFSNTSGQIRLNSTVSGVVTAGNVSTVGWIDTRGQIA